MIDDLQHGTITYICTYGYGQHCTAIPVQDSAVWQAMWWLQEGESTCTMLSVMYVKQGLGVTVTKQFIPLQNLSFSGSFHGARRVAPGTVELINV